MSAESVDLVVVGAGPAGISFAREWARLGRRVVVLEAGPTAGDSWRRMPRDMRLNSAWGASCLPGTRVPLWRYAKRLRRADFHVHLEQGARADGIELRTDWPVVAIAPSGADGFRLDSPRGTLLARRVVNATGYFSNPVVPMPPGREESSILQLSVPDYGSVDAVRERVGPGRRTIGIVGKRITAGQLALELCDAGFDVWISHRSPIEFASPIVLQQLGFLAYYPYEAIRLRLGRFAQRSSGLDMAGGRIARLLRKGTIRTVGPIDHFDADKIHLAGGEVETADAVLWATGYRPALGHLPANVPLNPVNGLPALDGAECQAARGLYFLGLDGQTDFTSRMLRGIRRDAIRLAREIAAAAGRAES